MKSDKKFFGKNIDLSIISVILFIILFPILFFPSTNDLAVYFQGGRVIFGQGKIFVDFFDLKPPLFYAFFGILSSISGKSVFFLRLLEFIIHFGTSIYLFLFLKKYFGTKIAGISSFVYSISVITLNFAVSYHLETLTNSLIILFTYLILQRDEAKIQKKKLLFLSLIGFIIGIFAGFKLTYLILLLVVVLYDISFLKLTFKNLIKNFLIIIPFLFLGLFLSYSWLLDAEIFRGFAQNWNYVTGYSNVNNYNFEFIKFAIKTISFYFGYFYSLLFLFGIFIASYYFLRSPQTKYPEFNFNQSKIIAVSITLILCLMISIIYEKKFFEYHFARLYIPMSILAGIGLRLIYKELRNRFRKKDFKGKYFYQIIIVFSILILVLMSPLPRALLIWKIPVSYYTGNETYFKYIDQLSDNTSNYYDKLLMSEFINKNIDSQKEILIASSSAYDLLFSINNKIINKFPQRALFLGPLKGAEFHKEFLKELHTADILIVQKNDYYRVQTGNDSTAYEELQKEPEALMIIENEYSKAFETKNLVLYRRLKE